MVSAQLKKHAAFLPTNKIFCGFLRFPRSYSGIMDVFSMVFLQLFLFPVRPFTDYFAHLTRVVY